ncbi:MAG: Gfo/Idh/MocA family oxidoreductase [Treponema sp.]|nr:Gfo/Idh/MocA family oxidoreductase [Treponema sp.]
MNIEPEYTAAIVGCGRIGYSLALDAKREQPASHTSALNLNPRIKIVAGCDTDPEALSVWKKANPQAETFASSKQLYQKKVPDIVVISVDEKNHLSESLLAMEAKPRLIILEKPVATNMKSAMKILETGREKNIPVLVNHERRFSNDYILAKQCMKKIGNLQSIRASLMSGMAVYNPREEASGAYSLLHDGTHLADAVLFFLEKDSLSGLSQSCERERGLLWKALHLKSNKWQNTMLHNPVISGVLRDESKCVRQMSAHYSTDECPDVSLFVSGRSKYFGFEIEITGTLGRITVGNGIFKVETREESSLYTGFYSLKKKDDMKAPEKTGYFSNMVQNAVDCLDGKEKLRSNLQSGINALAVMEEIKDSLSKS